MTKYSFKTPQSPIDPKEGARRIAEVYRRILEWNVPETIENNSPVRGNNSPVGGNRDLNVLINDNAKPADDAADLADEKANPRDDNGEFTND